MIQNYSNEDGTQEISKGWYVSGLLIIVILSWLMSHFFANRTTAPLKNVIVQDVQCQMTSNHNKEEFFIYTSGQNLAKELGQNACNNPVVKRQFGSARAFWNVNDVNTIKFIGKGIADLALVKENIMAALDAEDTHGYKKIARYPNYQAYFIARKEKPKLEKSYLLDKKIGLLDYPTSRSGNMLPKQILTNLGLSVDRMNIVYARSHGELRNLLLNGDVDIISSYWQREDNTNFSINYRTAIADSVSGSAWYLKLTNENSDLVCASQDLLRSIAQQQQLTYYKNLKLVPQAACETNDSSAWENQSETLK